MQKLEETTVQPPTNTLELRRRRSRFKLGVVDLDSVHLGFVAIAVVTLIYGFTYLVVAHITHRLPFSLINLGQFSIAALCFLPWLSRQAIAWRGGLELGFWVGLYYGLQAITLRYHSVHDSSFVLTLDTLFVPLLMGLSGKRPGLLLWLASGLAFTGVVVMTHDGTLPRWQDCWGILAALIYAVYLLRSAYWAQRVSSLQLTAAQMCCGAGLSMLWVLIFEHSWLTPAALGQIPWLPLLYLGAIATGLTTFLQFWGQQRINATQASITLAMEPIWASVFSFLLLSELPGLYGMLGGGVILCATLISIAANVEERSLP